MTAWLVWILCAALRALRLVVGTGLAGNVRQVRDAASGGGDHQQPHSAQALLALQVPCGAGDPAGGQAIPGNAAAAASWCVQIPLCLSFLGDASHQHLLPAGGEYDVPS